MTTFVLGDVHGQFEALERLLGRLDIDLGRDRLWLVGDLVNRGPQSLEVLRWARQLTARAPEHVAVVLGNHDLKLLAIAAGIGSLKSRDTFGPVLDASDRDELLDWLRKRPLLHRRGGDLLVHAGLLPQWTIEEAEKRAREVEERLADGGVGLLRDWRRRRPVAKAGRERRRQTLEVLARIRTCTRDGELCDWPGPPEGAPPGCRPWFRWPERGSAGSRIVFGHWAALGLHLESPVLGLDSGAGWSGRLTALRLDDGQVFQEPV